MPADKRPSEYGGSPGIIQPSVGQKTGSKRNLTGAGHTELTASEQAMILRSEGRRDAGMDETIPADDLHRGFVDERIADRKVRMAGRRVDEVK